jgi:hypothetical protein
MSSIKISCAGCKITFEKFAAEVKRQRKINPNRNFYCSMTCYAHAKGKVNLGNFLGNGPTDHLPRGSFLDEHSPFRYFMRKARNRKGNTDLDLPYLQTLWRAQGGRCAISGIQMELPIHGQAWAMRSRDPWKPSLDRIDNAKDYIKGNVRFITVIANFARNEFSDEQLLEFCRAVARHHEEGRPDSSTYSTTEAKARPKKPLAREQSRPAYGLGYN